MKRQVVVYDANVLYPAPLRDTLMRLALIGTFQARWTDAIHEEWIRNLHKNRPELSLQKLNRVRELMDKYVPDAKATGYEGLISTISLPDPDDRHVLAAAIHGKADAIITLNVKDFPVSELGKYGIERFRPDEFVLMQLKASPKNVIEALHAQRTEMLNPTPTTDDFLATLEQNHLSKSVLELRKFEHLI